MTIRPFTAPSYSRTRKRSKCIASASARSQCQDKLRLGTKTGLVEERTLRRPLFSPLIPYLSSRPKTSPAIHTGPLHRRSRHLSSNHSFSTSREGVRRVEKPRFPGHVVCLIVPFFNPGWLDYVRFASEAKTISFCFTVRLNTELRTDPIHLSPS